ncbi:MAG: hypothetical protein AB8B53_07250 [Flavobacteriales bacterium]
MRIVYRELDKNAKITFRQRLQRIFYFFPVQLLMLQLKRNYLLLSFWLLLFAFVLDVIGSKYGISHLFLYPEYRSINGPIAYGILGFSIGGFIVSYNLYTYIIHGHRFPFIATLEKPLFKFSINNFILPLGFIFTYMVQSYQFQTARELLSSNEAILNLSMFVVGILGMALLSFSYFTLTNRNVQYYATDKAKPEESSEEKEEAFASSALQKSRSWEDLEKRTDDWRVDTYMYNFFKIKLARSSKHYARDVLEKVFTQHHINASLFELIIIISFIVIGLFREYPAFEIPAAASAILYFTVLIMLVSAIYSWIKGWTAAVLLALVLTINFSPRLTEWFNLETRIYGVDYSLEKPDYSTAAINQSVSNEDKIESRIAQESVLDKWKSKVTTKPGEKPKLVIMSVSGGGLRSALWTMRSVLNADSLSSGELLDQTHLITGSSGGMYGASYLREIYLRSQSDSIKRYTDAHFEDISKDVLNPIILAMATHDLALRYRKEEVDGDAYLYDRAMSFEKKLHRNTHYRMDKTLGDYLLPEMNSEIPTLLFSPTITLDGRRLIMSSQKMSFLCSAEGTDLVENVSYMDMFENQNPEAARFSSVIRMNATFPYVLPATTLPTSVPIKVADAGLRDNFGLRLTLRYLDELEDWIENNTSGVIILEVRDTEKNAEKTAPKKQLINEVTAPLGGVYKNVIRIQDYDNDLQFNLLADSYGVPLYRIPFELEQRADDKVSLSWHLTKDEKEFILDGINSSDYQKSLDELLRLLNE